MHCMPNLKKYSLYCSVNWLDGSKEDACCVNVDIILLFAGSPMDCFTSAIVADVAAFLSYIAFMWMKRGE